MTSTKTIETMARDIHYGAREAGADGAMLAAYDLTREDCHWLATHGITDRADVIAIEAAVRRGPLGWDSLETD